MSRAAQCIAFCLTLASGPLYADWQLNLSPGVTPISHDIYLLHMTILWICVGIGVIVFGAIFYAVLYHRKSSGAEPAQFHEHLWLELTWTIIPLIILIVMAIPATRVLIHLNNNEEPDVTIKVTGYQWKWEYNYLDQGIKFFSNNATPFAEIHNQAPKGINYLRAVDHPMVVPIHKKIRFLFTSNDVIHAWFVPALGVQRDAVPGYITESWARINRPGVYYGQCNKLCGINHAYMPIVVMAVSEKEFADWLTVQKGGTVQAAPQPFSATVSKPTTAQLATASAGKITLEEAMKKGEQIYLNTCSVCHQPTGEGMPPVYPAMKDSKMAKGPIDEHLNRVLNGKPGTAMQAFRDQLSDDDIAAVVTYERNAWGNNMKDVIQIDQVKTAKAKPPTG